MSEESSEALRDGELPLARESVEALTDLARRLLPTSRSAIGHWNAARFPIVGLSGKCGDMGMLWSTLRAEGVTEHREANGMLSKLCYPKLNYARWTRAWNIALGAGSAGFAA